MPEFSIVQDIPQDMNVGENFPEKGWIYSKNDYVILEREAFTRVDADYQGRRYEVIGRKISPLKTDEKIFRLFFIGSLITAIAAAVFLSFNIFAPLSVVQFLLTRKIIFQNYNIDCFYLKKVEDKKTYVADPQTIKDFPEEIFKHILLFLETADVTRMGRVSKTAHHAANELQLWEKRCKQPILGLEEWKKRACPKLEGIEHPNSQYFEFKVPPIPKFAYQFLEIRGDSFDLFLNPNFTGKTFWNILNNLVPQEEIDEFMKNFIEKKTIVGSFWMLMSKSHIPGSLNAPPLEQEYLVHHYDSKFPFDLPTRRSLTFYKLLKSLQGNWDNYYSLLRGPYDAGYIHSDLRKDGYTHQSKTDDLKNELLRKLVIKKFSVLQVSTTEWDGMQSVVINSDRNEYRRNQPPFDVAAHACLTL